MATKTSYALSPFTCSQMKYLSLLVVITFHNVYSTGGSSSVRSKIDAFIENIITCRNIPGLNLAVVKDGRVLFTNGYGMREVGQSDRVDNATHFGIASISKGFSSTLLAKVLSDKGYWFDDSVTSRVGALFNFSDVYRTKRATFRDILAHKMGLPSYNYARLQDGFDREQLAKKLYLFNASTDFRTKFMYNNLMYGLASHVTEQLGEDSWENLMTNKIFKPLSMDGTTFTHTVNFSDVKYARPHLVDRKTDTYRPVSMQLHSEWGKLGGSGSIFSTADDMAKWLLFQLNGGKNQHGDQVVEEEYFKETHKETFFTGKPSYSQVYTRPTVPVTYSYYNYGLGWRVGYYRSYEMVLHTGTSWGYGALLTLIPSLGIGIHTSINGEDPSYTARRLIHMYIMDLLMDEEPWLNQTTACTFPEPWVVAKPKQHRVQNTFNTTRPLADYVGTYGDFAYGNMTVVLEGSDLRIRYGKIGRWILHPLQEQDGFSGEGTDAMWPLSLEQINFRRDSNDKVISVEIPNFGSLAALQFIRDLKMADAPSPPVECPDATVQSTDGATTLKLHSMILVFVIYLQMNWHDFI